MNIKEKIYNIAFHPLFDGFFLLFVVATMLLIIFSIPEPKKPVEKRVIVIMENNTDLIMNALTNEFVDGIYWFDKE